MYPRTKYVMSENDLKELLENMKPVPCMMIGGTTRSPQENANSAWNKLGDKMGFDGSTVQPTGQGDRFFSAIPNETEEQKAIRVLKEEKEKLKTDIVECEAEIVKHNIKIEETLKQLQAL